MYQCINGGTNEEIRLDLLRDVFTRCIGETLNTVKRPLGREANRSQPVIYANRYKEYYLDQRYEYGAYRPECGEGFHDFGA